MLLKIHLPARDQAIESARSNWVSLVNDPWWERIEGKFETNVFGQVIVSPPPPSFHSSRASQIAFILQCTLNGRGMVEFPVLTIDGVKVPDAVWYSTDRYAVVRGQVAADIAPEICVEVISQGNTAGELQHKRGLYFEAGAIECWQCDLQGRVSYTHRDQPSHSLSSSSLCPSFPQIISD